MFNHIALTKSAFDVAETDKGEAHQYHHMYGLLFAAVTPKSLLEVGVLSGNSMLAWKKLFPEAALTGLDNKERELVTTEFEYVFGDSTDPSVTKKLSTYDVIIDDGSHHIYDQILTFNNLKDKFNYFYVIEDIGWQHRDKDRDHVLKTLIECVKYAGFHGIATFESHNPDRCCYSLVIFGKGGHIK